MMKKKHCLATRVCSTVIALCLMSNILPISAIAAAVDDDKPIAVSWMPQEQTENGTRNVAFTVSLDLDDIENIAAAMVEIALDEEEAGALKWDGERVNEPEQEKPSGTYDTNDDTSSTYTSSDDTSVLSVQQLPLQRTSTEPQAVLINKTEGGAVLRVQLSGNAEYKKTLAFSAIDEVDVSDSDIKIQTYDSGGLPDLKNTPLLTTSDNTAFSFEGNSFTVLDTIPDEISITPSHTLVDLDGENSKDITYTIVINRPFAAEKPDTNESYAFTLTWPSELTRPSGELTASGPENGVYTISCDTTTLAVLTSGGASVSNVAAEDSGLTFTVTPLAGVEACNLTLTVKGDAFTRASEPFSESMTLLTKDSGGASVSASVTVKAGAAKLPGEQAGHTVYANNKDTNITQTVGWADNEDEEHKRPAYGRGGEGQFYPRIFFTINGVRTELTDETLENVGLSDWPEIQGKTGGGGFTLSGLPSSVTDKDGFGNEKTYTVTWSVEPPATPPTNYACVEVTEDNKNQYPSVSQLGWYYMLQGDFVFTLEVKQGEPKNLTDEQIAAIRSSFQFEWTFGNTTQSESIDKLVENGHASITSAGSDGTVTITGLWKYNLDGSPISFKITELGEDPDYRLDGQEFHDCGLLPDKEDWLQIMYDNSKVPNHGDDTKAVYNGGTLRLLLSGETTFSAQKSWLDEKPDEGLDSRPDVTFTLWRYREGQSYTTAAPVKDGTENVTYVLQSGKGTAPEQGSYNTYIPYSYYPVSFKDKNNDTMSFPKYDPDGYAYIYGAKETTTYVDGDNNYETIYGVINENGKFVYGSDKRPYGGTERPTGDTLLYNGGVLTNRLKDSTLVTAKKTWEAAAYQAAFKDVAVELTLQSKLKGTDDAWENVKDDDGNEITHYLCNFAADRLTESYSASMPQYDAQGLELVYRWVETAVYQNVNGATDEEVREEINNGTATKCEIKEETDGTRTFTMVQGIGNTTEEVTYVSETKDGGTIYNHILDTIEYKVIKKWEGGAQEKSVIINIYQVPSGSTDFDLSKAYVTFSYDEAGMLDGPATGIGVTNDDVSVTQDKDTNGADLAWHATVNDLPRFDENGRPYEYVLLEANNFPEYETTRDENGNYQTTVTNGPGPGDVIQILVRKVWLDDGDDLHREPVTFTVYNRNKDTELKTVTLGGKENLGLWHEVVEIEKSTNKNDPNGVFDVNDLYVVETAVGDHAVDHHLNPTIIGQDRYKALYDTGTGDGDEIFDVTTDNHRYQVNYKYEAGTNNGVAGTFTVTNRRLGNIDLTVEKSWTDGDHDEILNQIKAELQDIANGENGKKLALVFKLRFTDEDKNDNPNDGWEITYTGFEVESDTVQVGGTASEKVQIYKSYTDGTKTTYGETASSEQVIIGVDKDGEVNTAEEARFFGLPKYDAEGKAVEYTVKELWLEVTNSGEIPKPVDNMEAEYPDLWALWQDYQVSCGTPKVEGTDNHTKETQTMEVNNYRSHTKDVTWTKVWKDYFTYNSSLRPDIYLDIYAVSHVSDGNGGVKQQITRVQKDIKWTSTDANNWTVTLPAVAEYDSLGYEIKYYAVERTVVAVGDYDYQAVKYSLKDTDLGDRDNPASDAVANGNVLDLKGADYLYSGFQLDDLGIGIYTPGAGVPTYPQYALIEGGTFTNSLAKEYTIEGMKYWTSLPSGWKEVNLPSVTFNVYRSSADTDFTPAAENHVASLTITSDQWQDLKNGLSYRYQILYAGKNQLSKDSEGNLVCTAVDANPARLDRYDDAGKLYTYKVTETVNWEGSSIPAGDRVFAQINNAFTFTNEYNPTEGSIRVKKFLYLSKDKDGNLVYPAVTFTLTRQVQNTVGGDYEPDSYFQKQTKKISSADVQKAYEELIAEGKTADYITEYVLFTNLDIYAPNGTKYMYTVTEDKSQLNGFDTWAVAGDVAVEQVSTEGITISDLTPRKSDDSDAEQAQATFKNKQPTTPDTYQNFFTATKVWDDNGNAYQFRPNKEKFEMILEYVEKDADGKVTWTALKRTAASQTGQGNGMTEYLVPNQDFTVDVYVNNSDTNAYRIEIKPASGTAFDLYAPNGMPWVYSLSEPIVKGENRLQINLTELEADENKIYAPPANTGGTWQTTIKPATGSAQQSTDFGSLTNSTHMEYAFQKIWVDANGTQILNNYLGDDFKLTVTFQLQVSGDNMQTWHNASEYFIDLDTAAIKVTGATQGTSWDTATITGKVNSTVWSTGGKFTKLPTAIQDAQGNYTFLQYRVIETKVAYGTQVQTIAWNEQNNQYAAITGTGLVTEATFYRTGNGLSTSQNKLSTTQVSVTKVWDDGDNQYNTRPGAEAPMTWTAWYVLQRTTNQGQTWENVAVTELYGTNGSSKDNAPSTERWEYTFSGLPTVNYSNTQNYVYRIRELQPKEGGYTLNDAEINANIVEGGEDDPYNPGGSAYITEYKGSQGFWEVTNRLEVYNPPPVPNVSTIKVVKEWAVPNTDTSIKPDVIFQLQYRKAGSSEEWQSTAKANFTNAEETANANNGWAVTWISLPDTILGEEVEYQVVELSGTGWVQLEQSGEPEDDSYTYTFTNTLTRDFSVEKMWNPTKATKHAVTVWLYRTTDSSKVGTTGGERVPENEMAPDQNYRTVELSTSNNWKSTFTGLPKYNEDSQLYYYYALEVGADGNPVTDGNGITLEADRYIVAYKQGQDNAGTTITNTPVKSLSGTKTWKDGSNEGSTRPDSLTLILERQTNGQINWEQVTATPTWTNNGNTWTYTYTDLPTHNASGSAYSYRVREEVPDGYELENQKVDGADGEVEPVNDCYNFTNVRTGTVDLTVNKTWVGDTEGNRPANITLKVERKLITDPDTAWTDVTPNPQPPWTKTAGSNEWILTYSNMPQYDGDSVRYQYRITEDGIPVGYEVIDSTNTDPTKTYEIRNIRKGALEIRKEVSGNRGETDRAFHFTVTLTGNSLAGTGAAAVSGPYSAVYTLQDDTTGRMNITFTAGQSEPISLKDGESIVINGLPAGLTYEVTETERNTDGYSTSGTGWNGSIPIGAAAQAEFDNYRNSGSSVTHIDVTGTKTWVDDNNADGTRPASIELILYRSVDGGAETEVNATPVWTKNGNVWTYHYTGLLKYDGSGKAYTYRVAEVVPAGYQVQYDGLNITNYKGDTDSFGDLQISKQVAGEGADNDRIFSFRVTLLDETINGTYGELTFAKGVAVFMLKHGQSVKATGLPAGLSYTVSESYTEGYTASGSNWTGEIPGGGMADVQFVNTYQPDEPLPPDDPDGDPNTPDDDPNIPDDDPDISDDGSNQPGDNKVESKDGGVRTGDPAHPGLLAALAAMFTGGLILTLYLGRRRRRHKRGS